jgi:hypothetical protein
MTWLEDIFDVLKYRHGAVDTDYQQKAVYWNRQGVKVGATISDYLHAVLIRDKTGKGWIYDLHENDTTKIAGEVMEIVNELWGS